MTWRVILNEEHPMDVCLFHGDRDTGVSGRGRRPCLGLHVPIALDPLVDGRGDQTGAISGRTRPWVFV